MEYLSIELIERIIKFCLDSKDLASLCQVNKLYNAIVTRPLYRHIMIKTPICYLTLKDALQARDLHDFVYRLDFSGYTTRGCRWSEVKAKSLLLPEELAHFIQGCTHLKELMIGPELQHTFTSPLLLHAVFSNSNHLETLDLIDFCDRVVCNTISDYVKNHKGCISNPLRNVSFYMCLSLTQADFFIPYLKQLQQNGNQLKRLDLGYTRINADLFSYLHATFCLTHLNLQGCVMMRCCSPLIRFIENSPQLVHLNLNQDFARSDTLVFCHNCLYRILKSLNNNNKVHTLDLSGHVNMDDLFLNRLILDDSFRPFRCMNILSIAGCHRFSLPVLQQFLMRLCPHLSFINLTSTLSFTLQELVAVIAATSIQVIEMNSSSMKGFPLKVSGWTLATQGRRTYYSRNKVDPRYVYAKKLILVDKQPLTPMNTYRCYSY